ncbi:hypothetical protein FA95DRAFT_1563180 [Auriscalpium vulgare]|uniref:Uncharacterized protein n=1 Tax=Auriscalpium vulgare TaxID=40419 RepID=A0ACB8RHN5_9AGAM|nr:hypothetical protein FA95DRAFT_1563180 [Auriscalpium vulgare]
MSLLLYLSALASTAFRAGSYIFLQVIPLRPLWNTLLPLFYALYILPYVLPSPAKAAPTVENGKTSEPTKKEKKPTSTDNRDVTWELLFSLPSTRTTKLITFVVNTALLLGAVDFALSPLYDTASDVVFTRVGAVYPDAAKLVVRYPFTNSTEDERAVQVLWRRASNTTPTAEPWTDGPLVSLSPAHDWTNTTQISTLWPNTEYEYAFADTNRTLLEYPPTPIRFRTFPDPRLPSGSHFRFVASSCMTPNFPYVPLQGRTIKGFDLLADHLAAESSKAPTPGFVAPVVAADNSTDSPIPLEDTLSEEANSTTTAEELTETFFAEAAGPKTEFMLFLGDFIYADVPVYFGDNVEAYRRLYRRNYQSPSFRRVYERLPIFHAYDDHEIINNYYGQSNDSAPFTSAADPFKIYNADANYNSVDKDQHYYDFRYGDIAYFVLDTRRYRSDPYTEDVVSRTMLGDKQLAALYEWLGKVNSTATFKFIVSSVPFTSLWTHEAVTDSWAGYPYEKAALLSALHTVPNVFLLSGDRHEFAAIEFNGPTAESHPVYEFSTSPMNMFYVPLLRTLRPRSEATVVRTSTGILDESGEIGVISEELPQENVLKYLPIGNTKWSSIEVDTRNPDEPKLLLDVIIDGKSQYKHTITGKPVKLKSSTALAALVPDGIKDILGRVGLSPSKWF